MGLIKRHPVLFGILSFLLIVVPGAIEAWWSLLSAGPLVPTLAKSVGVASMPDLPWLTVVLGPIGLIGLVMLAIIVIQTRPRETEESAEPKPHAHEELTMAMEDMSVEHGHVDEQGLLECFRTGKSFNAEPCWVCGQPRFQPSRSIDIAQLGESQRRNALLAKLRQEYILSHDGISPKMMAGTEPIPKDWVEARLEELGETWRQDEYY